MTNDFTCPDSPEELGRIPSGAAPEAPAEWRNAATQFRQFFIALTSAGFSAGEALELVKTAIAAGARSGLANPDE